jgi:hypothetical protein
MNCIRPICHCLVTKEKDYILNDKSYCNEACASQCTNEECVCVDCDCEKL